MILSTQILERFTQWLEQAKQQDATYYNGMSIATVSSSGQPSNRVVLMKSVDESGLTFFTNYDSDKGEELAQNAKIAATFWWSAFQRQVRIEGSVTKTTKEESEAYFAQRPLLSQVAAAVSKQSQPIESFELLKQQFEDKREQWGDNVPCPDNWGGYRIDAHKIEFWQGKDHRLHERHLYQAVDGQWVMSILQP